ncbi:MAG TPA: 2'-5' RNA ligase family protein [Planctomycetota bacterium]|nr:2'-5' RNA ligase family protein [Planctomycetota bacterium]
MIPQRHPKTPNTAVVLIPPDDIWEPIQAIRLLHDSHVKRWMPHVTLLFPFFPADLFPEAEGKLESACREAAPFRVRLARFDYFQGPKTAWIEPEPAESVCELQAVLQSRFPYCDDVARHAGGFRPHLSVGQGPPNLPGKLQVDWRPLEFEAREIALIRRDGPEDPFRVHRTFPLKAH